MSSSDRSLAPARPGERVQALQRGLAVLAFLNRHGAASCGEVAAAVGLKTSTAHRILGVLVDLALVRHDVPNHQYALTANVGDLSAGLRDEAWIEQVAGPLMAGWTNEQRWPLALVTPFGLEALVRVSTDARAPISADRWIAGQAIPWTSIPLDTLVCAFPPEEPASAAAVPVDCAENEIAAVRRRGWVAELIDSGQGGRLGVPICMHDRVRGYLVMRCLPSVVTVRDERAAWATALQALAGQLSAEASPLIEH